MQMLAPLRAAVSHHVRFYATPSPTQIYPRPIRDPAGIRHTEVGGPLRPQLGFRVNSKHGLWAFFRKVHAEEGTEGGKASYEIVPVTQGRPIVTGRSWESHELRRKSFVDLHTLWYILLRERNLLVTQKETMRRMGASNAAPGQEECAGNMRLVRKSMARIKQVLNERRVAYEGALKIHSEQLTKSAVRIESEEKLAAEEAVKEAKRLEREERMKVAHFVKERVRRGMMKRPVVRLD